MRMLNMHDIFVKILQAFLRLHALPDVCSSTAGGLHAQSALLACALPFSTDSGGERLDRRTVLVHAME